MCYLWQFNININSETDIGNGLPSGDGVPLKSRQAGNQLCTADRSVHFRLGADRRNIITHLLYSRTINLSTEKSSKKRICAKKAAVNRQQPQFRKYADHFAFLFCSLRRSLISVRSTSSLGGSAGFSASFFLPMLMSLLTAFTMRNMQNAMIRKLMIVVMK